MNQAERVPGWVRTALASVGALAAPVPALALAVEVDDQLRWAHVRGMPVGGGGSRGELLGLGLYALAMAAQHLALRRLARGRAEVALTIGLAISVLVGLGLALYL